MKLIDLYPSFFCLYIKDRKGEEKQFLQKDISSSFTRSRLDLFKTEESLYHWVMEEQEIQAQNDLWGMHAIYARLYSKKIYSHEFSDLMKENKEIDSVTFSDKDGLMRLYFRSDFDHNYDFFPIPKQKLYPKEPIYIINRQRKLNEQVILQKESYFITYPEIGTPLFSVGIGGWADELISRRENEGYYIEQTTLYDLYNQTKLNSKDPGLFILARENAPHYILRQNNLKMIIDGIS